MKDAILEILRKYYGKSSFGASLCDAMADRIVTGIEEGDFITRADVMLYIWMNTSGGGVAEMAAQQIQQALPDILIDSDERTPYRRHRAHNSDLGQQSRGRQGRTGPDRSP